MTEHSTHERLVEIINATDRPKVGQVWQHYKGDKYEVTGASLDEATETVHVLYKSYEKPLPLPWSRPISEWAKTVLYQGKEVPRFSLMRKTPLPIDAGDSHEE